jgi:hypothetical protein
MELSLPSIPFAADADVGGMSFLAKRLRRKRRQKKKKRGYRSY